MLKAIELRKITEENSVRVATELRQKTDVYIEKILEPSLMSRAHNGEHDFTILLKGREKKMDIPYILDCLHKLGYDAVYDVNIYITW